MNWTSYNSSFSNPLYTLYITQAFRYKSSNSFPNVGEYTTYSDSGYLYELDPRRNTSLIRNELLILQNLNWIDKHTRALVIEFSIFNPNINLFVYCWIIFEYLPTGSVIKQTKFAPFSLYETGKSAFFLSFDVIYLVIIVFFMVQEIISITKKRVGYLKEGWNYLKWLLFSLTWVAFVIYLYRLYSRYDLIDNLSLIRSNSTLGFITFHNLNYWSEIMMSCLALCSFIATLLFIQVLSYSRLIKFMTQVIRSSFVELINFILVIFVVMGAFTNLFYLVFNERSSRYSTIVDSIEESLMIVVGKFQTTCRIKFNSALEPLMICLFAISMLFIILRLFFGVIVQQYSKAKANYISQRSKESSLVRNYLHNRLKKLFGVRTYDRCEAYKYKDFIASFEDKSKKLIKKANEIYFEYFFFINL